MDHSEISEVLDACELSDAHIEPIRPNHGVEGNANWHVRAPGRPRAVLRRYHAETTRDDLAWENGLLDHLAEQGWSVPAALTAPIEHRGRWYCLTGWVPGAARTAETPDQQRQRGADLARLHVALRDLPSPLAQRPGWQPLHPDLPVMTPLDWDRGLHGLAAQHPDLADWVRVAVAATAAELQNTATELPQIAVHGDFLAGENVHYLGDRLAGVIDFGVAHHGTRIYDVISARTYRQPQVGRGYAEQMDLLGWPITATERAAMTPIYRAFRLFMLGWHLDVGLRTGRFNAASILSQLSQTAIDESGHASQPPVNLKL